MIPVVMSLPSRTSAFRTVARLDEHQSAVLQAAILRQDTGKKLLARRCARRCMCNNMLPKAAPQAARIIVGGCVSRLTRMLRTHTRHVHKDTRRLFKTLRVQLYNYK